MTFKKPQLTFRIPHLPNEPWGIEDGDYLKVYEIGQLEDELTGDEIQGRGAHLFRKSATHVWSNDWHCQVMTVVLLCNIQTFARQLTEELGFKYPVDVTVMGDDYPGLVSVAMDIISKRQETLSHRAMMNS